MKLKVYMLLIAALLCASNQALAKHGRCYGTLWATSDPSEIIEEHSDRVSVYLPLKVQVSDTLLNCADEIWIEDVYYYSLVFTGPTEYKYARLLDSQFNTMWPQSGIWRIPLTSRSSQLWARLQHYSLFPAGSYTGSVKVSIVRRNRVIEEQYLDMAYYSQPQVAVSLDNASKGKVSGSNGHYQINLGELKSDMRFYWGINILSNSSYDIVLDSEYNGLRHETDTQALIDYSITFDNVKISSSERLIRSYNFFPGVRNKWFGFEFILGNTELMPAGYYRDNLSLTVYPK
ncbi:MULTISPECIES: hypothetical protein [Pseudoalteromonas]|uniref:Uncharacterized protein n=1 Tax=Pseudoalteromonas amylolytica TaxID=1859457 RepID=A0A1S1MPF6_9GAMM|nr:MULTISPECIES: hypothetical protein [Pseudoalteromonas]MCF6435446.1 hypothetical protein [Pseudoalteromonas sp. MMG022]OHU88468.1 hypothetical protein BFC16_07180 [Pseudoalteromonas sp. JW3]OHU90311.1 hypothetical protein BET10_13010 [Pseudoalteromonas amylolytica]